MSAAAYAITQAVKAEVYGTEPPQIIPLINGTWVKLVDDRVGIIRNYFAATDTFVVELHDREFGAYAWPMVPTAQIRHAIHQE